MLLGVLVGVTVPVDELVGVTVAVNVVVVVGVTVLLGVCDGVLVDVNVVVVEGVVDGVGVPVIVGVCVAVLVEVSEAEPVVETLLENTLDLDPLILLDTVVVWVVVGFALCVISGDAEPILLALTVTD